MAKNRQSLNKTWGLLRYWCSRDAAADGQPAPRFSIVIPHFDGCISDAAFRRCVESIRAQTFSDYEVLIHHDGAPSRPLIPIEDWPQLNHYAPTQRRYGDWGHSLRDRGIRVARGEYIIHLNSDNVLYPGTLESLAGHDDDILIPRLRMMGLERDGRGEFFYSEPRDYARNSLLTGKPVKLGNIDCMQFVMKRRLWLHSGGWHDRSEISDGRMYSKLAKRYSVRYVHDIMGEHW